MELIRYSYIRKRFRFHLVFLLIVFSTFTAHAIEAGSKRSLFVWNMANDPDQLAEFCIEKGISQIYLSAYSELNNNPEALRDYLRILYSYELEVHYLTGSSSWASSSKNFGLNQIDKLIRFNQSEPSFTGLQLDVEPHTLDDWPSQELWDSYLDFLEKSKAKVESARPRIDLGVVIPFWLDSQNSSTYSLVDVQSIADYLVVMAYRDTAEKIIAYSANEIAAGPPAIIAVETLSGLDDKLGFQEEGIAYMEDELAKVSAVYPDTRIAIHHYVPYLSLPTFPEGSIVVDDFEGNALAGEWRGPYGNSGSTKRATSRSHSPGHAQYFIQNQRTVVGDR